MGVYGMTFWQSQSCGESGKLNVYQGIIHRQSAAMIIFIVVIVDQGFCPIQSLYISHIICSCLVPNEHMKVYI